MRKEHQAAADYISSLSAELARIAYRHDLDSAAYMLELASVEAASAKSDLNGRARRPLDELLG